MIIPTMSREFALIPLTSYRLLEPCILTCTSTGLIIRMSMRTTTRTGDETGVYMHKDPRIVTAPDLLRHLDAEQVVVLNSDIGPIDTQQEEALYDFVERGGGLVCLGDAAEAYREYPLLGEVLGHVHGTCTPRSEIIARVAAPDHYLTRRMDTSFAVYEGVYVLDIVPRDAEILWYASWRYTKCTGAYARDYGLERVFCTVLGSDPETET